MKQAAERTRADARVYNVAGRNTVVQFFGSGSPIVFLHGAGTFPGFGFAPAWARSRSVIVPYHPGFGGSEGDTLGSLEAYVAHYDLLLDALGIQSADLVGFSLGGWIAAEIAARPSSPVRKLVLIAPAGLVVEEALAPDLSTVPPSEMPSYLTHDPDVTRGFLPREPDPVFEARLAKEAGGYAKLLRENPQGDPTLASRLSRITAPTLLLWGSEDRLRPTAQSRAWQARLPNCTTAIVEGAGHLVFEEAPASAKTVLNFLNA